MQKTLFVLLLCTTPGFAAENPETLAERSQAKARKVIDAAVTAIGGREALQGIETLQLQLQGERGRACKCRRQVLPSNRDISRNRSFSI